MSFTCSTCGVHQLPRTKPTLVAESTRPQTYENMVPIRDEEGDIIDEVLKVSAGTEIVSEKLMCPSCLGIDTKPEVRPNYFGYRAIVQASHDHARKCKEILSECGRCQKTIQDVRMFPLAALTFSLMEQQVKSGFFSLGSVVVTNLLRRTNEHSKRAKADFAVGFSIMKTYEERGGTL